MKRQIRTGVFETNSSSTHAICISKDTVDKTKLPDHITFSHGDFGWEFDVLKDMYDRAAYLNEALRYVYDSKEQIQEKKDYIALVLSRYGISVEFEDDKYVKNSWSDEPYYDSGYIDHGGDTVEFVSAVMNDEDKLLIYLFGDSFIVTGNDNSDEWHNYMYKESEGWSHELKDKFNNYEVYEKWN